MTTIYDDDKEAIFGGFVIRGRPKTNLLNFRYKGYSFQSQFIRKQIIGKGQGAIRVNIGQSDLRKVVFPIPPLVEQKAIAGILRKWDRAISILQELIRAKKHYKKGLMQQLLSGKKRFPEFEGEPCVEVEFKDIIAGDRIKGKSVKLNSKKLGVPYIGSTSFGGNFNEYTEDPNAVIAKKKDLLLLWDGEYAGKVTTNLEGAASSTVAVIRLDEEKVNNHFMKLLMEFDNTKIRAITEGSGIPHIPTDFISWYKINLPPKKEQDKIAALIGKIETEISILREKTELLKKQKKGLMQQLLTGKVRVNKELTESESYG